MKTPKHIIETLITNKNNHKKIGYYGYWSWNKREVLMDYFDINNKILRQEGKDIIDEFNKLVNLFNKFHYIKGITQSNRQFKLSYDDKKVKFLLNIYDGKDVHIPDIEVSDIFRKNILYIVNKKEDEYFNKKSFKGKKERTLISVKCRYDEIPLNVFIKLNNISNVSHFSYLSKKYQFLIYISIPNHIPYEQYNYYLYKHLLDEDNLEKYIKNNILFFYDYSYLLLMFL